MSNTATTNVAKQLKEAKEVITDLLALLPTATCDMFHHTKKDRHSLSEPCPCVTRYNHKLTQAYKVLGK